MSFSSTAHTLFGGSRCRPAAPTVPLSCPSPKHATGKNFASVSTILPSGRIQTQTTWAHVENGKLVLNTETHRAKHININRDPRITVLIRDEQDPYCYAEVRGRIIDTTTGGRARTKVDELAHKYLGKDYPPEAVKSERVILWITPSGRPSSTRTMVSPTETT